VSAVILAEIYCAEIAAAKAMLDEIEPAGPIQTNPRRDPSPPTIQNRVLMPYETRLTWRVNLTI
jgi:hypothetical protein